MFELLFIAYVVVTIGLFFLLSKLTIRFGDKSPKEDVVFTSCIAFWPILAFVSLLLFGSAFVSKLLRKLEGRDNNDNNT